MICKPCKGGIPPLMGDELRSWHKKLANDWELIDNHHISKSYSLSSFAESMLFTNKIADLAENIGHHPVIVINFKEVKLDIWTHKINGLADADFIFAAKVDEINIS